ncbi:MAG: aminotransferase class I/II-fold pyridoxal phosphate-dependent enzyme, partial [Acidobacteriota bacterium]
AGCDCLASTGPIVPVMIGDNRSALAVADALARRGWDVRAIRPPTVAPGTARLRISVHADHDDAQLDALADDVVRALRVHAATAAARAPGAAAMTEVPV